MSRPPMMMRIQVKNKDVNFGLWLPLFLIAVLLAAIVIILSPLIILAMIIMLMTGLERWVRFILLSIWAVTVSLWAMRGLEVDVQNARGRVYISVF